MVNHRDLPLPGTPQKADSPVGVRQRISRQLGAGSLEAKMVDDRAPAPVKLNAGKRSPAHSPRNAPEKVKDGVPSSSQSKPAATSAETNTNLVASLRRNSDFMLAFAVIGVICMMVQVRAVLVVEICVAPQLNLSVCCCLLAVCCRVCLLSE